MRHTGLDLSLTATGIAHIHTTPDNTTITTHTITSSGTKHATLTDRATRLRRLRNTLTDHCLHSDLIVIEAPATDPECTNACEWRTDGTATITITND